MIAGAQTESEQYVLNNNNNHQHIIIHLEPLKPVQIKSRHSIGQPSPAPVESYGINTRMPRINSVVLTDISLKWVDDAIRSH